MQVRPEQKGDEDAIRKVHTQAFGQGGAEAALVDRLRAGGAAAVSLVAVVDGGVAGHVVFSRVGLQAGGGPLLFGLGPMGVLPARQRRGVGAALVAAGLDACRREHADGVVLVGHPEYYPRFGFRPAAEFGLRCEFPVPAPFFMAIELADGGLAGHAGLVRYSPEFGKL